MKQYIICKIDAKPVTNTGGLETRLKFSDEIKYRYLPYDYRFNSHKENAANYIKTYLSRSYELLGEDLCSNALILEKR
jgi:hypothetical protein